MDFTYSAYQKLINLIKNEGYSFSGYGGDNKGKFAIIRHDVDIDLKKAAEFSCFEAGIYEKIDSTYMLLLTSDFYNIHSVTNRKYIRQILKNGHNIGLHFDETQYSMDERSEMEFYIKKEIDILSDIAETQINVVSMHRPSKMTLQENIHIEGIENSYSKEYFDEIKYISDSRHCWREDVLDAVTSGRFDKLQILTHPFWYKNDSESTKDIVSEYLQEKRKRDIESLDNNITDFKGLLNISDLSQLENV